MATVPGILYITTAMGNGGYPTTSGGSAFNSDFATVLNDKELLRIVPQDAVGNPTADFYPWFDGSASRTNAVYNLDEAACTATTLVMDTNPGWTTNQWQNRIVTIVNGEPSVSGLVFSPNIAYFPYAFEQRNLASRIVGRVASNTSNTITLVESFVSAPHSLPPNPGTRIVIGDGRFTQYAAIPGKLNGNSGGGSTWAGNGQGIGPDARMVPELNRRIYKSAPYFYFVKYAQPDGLYSGFRTGGNGRVGLLAQLQDVAAAAAAQGNVIQWQLVIVDISDEDLGQLAANNTLLASHVFGYQANMVDLINWLRSSSALQNSAGPYNFVGNSSIYAQISHPHPDLWGVGAFGAAEALRTANRQIAIDLPRVALIDMADAYFAPLTEAPLVNSLVAERKYYSRESLLGKTQSFAMKSVTLFERQLAGLPTGEATNGFPIYFLGGDSIAVGPITTPWADNCASLSLIGPGPGTVKPATELIFNRQSNVFEAYDPNQNSNTSGTVWPSAGPEMSMFAELAKQHPNGFGIVKHAINGASLSNNLAPYVTAQPASGGRFLKSAQEVYPGMLQSIRAAIQYVNNNMGRQADFRGAVFSLGHNDTGGSTPAQSLSFANLFAQNIGTFVADLRTDLTTRTSGKPFPVVFRRPQALATSANPSSLIVVRNALEALAKTDSQVRVVDVDDLERDRVDNVHETPESSITSGRRLTAALVAASV